jgi:hypothetical protein
VSVLLLATIAVAPPLVFADDRAAAGVAAKCKVSKVARVRGREHVSVSIHVDPVPVRLVHRLFLRRAGGGAEARGETLYVGTNCGSGYDGMTMTGLPSAVDRVDVILRPDLDAIRRQVDATPVWGGEVVIPNIPVQTVDPASTGGEVTRTEAAQVCDTCWAIVPHFRARPRPNTAATGAAEVAAGC